MKSSTLLLAVAVSWASASAFAQPIVARGEVRIEGCPDARTLCKQALVPVSQAARAGNIGAVLLYGDYSRLRLAPGSEFETFGGIPVRPVLEAPLEYANATSAIKSINTQRISEGFRYEADQAATREGLFLRSGNVLVDERTSSLDIRVMEATLSGPGARYAVSLLSPRAARVTVAEGRVTVSVPGESPRIIHSGDFVMLGRDACGKTVAGEPRSVCESALARADEADLTAGMASRLSPVGECVDLQGDLEPVCERVGVMPAVSTGLPSVGTGPSVPFDLTHGPNNVNVNGLVQSPEAP